MDCRETQAQVRIAITFMIETHQSLEANFL